MPLLHRTRAAPATPATSATSNARPILSAVSSTASTATSTSRSPSSAFSTVSSSPTSPPLLTPLAPPKKLPSLLVPTTKSFPLFLSPSLMDIHIPLDPLDVPSFHLHPRTQSQSQMEKKALPPTPTPALEIGSAEHALLPALQPPLLGLQSKAGPCTIGLDCAARAQEAAVEQEERQMNVLTVTDLPWALGFSPQLSSSAGTCALLPRPSSHESTADHDHEFESMAPPPYLLTQTHKATGPSSTSIVDGTGVPLLPQSKVTSSPQRPARVNRTASSSSTFPLTLLDFLDEDGKRASLFLPVPVGNTRRRGGSEGRLFSHAEAEGEEGPDSVQSVSRLEPHPGLALESSGDSYYRQRPSAATEAVGAGDPVSLLLPAALPDDCKTASDSICPLNSTSSGSVTSSLGRSNSRPINNDTDADPTSKLAHRSRSAPLHTFLPSPSPLATPPPFHRSTTSIKPLRRLASNFSLRTFAFFKDDSSSHLSHSQNSSFFADAPTSPRKAKRKESLANLLHSTSAGSAGSQTSPHIRPAPAGSERDGIAQPLPFSQSVSAFRSLRNKFGSDRSAGPSRANTPLPFLSTESAPPPTPGLRECPPEPPQKARSRLKASQSHSTPKSSRAESSTTAKGILKSSLAAAAITSGSASPSAAAGTSGELTGVGLGDQPGSPTQLLAKRDGSHHTPNLLDLSSSQRLQPGRRQQAARGTRSIFGTLKRTVTVFRREPPGTGTHSRAVSPDGFASSMSMSLSEAQCQSSISISASVCATEYTPRPPTSASVSATTNDGDGRVGVQDLPEVQVGFITSPLLLFSETFWARPPGASGTTPSPPLDHNDKHSAHLANSALVRATAPSALSRLRQSSDSFTPFQYDNPSSSTGDTGSRAASPSAERGELGRSRPSTIALSLGPLPPVPLILAQTSTPTDTGVSIRNFVFPSSLSPAGIPIKQALVQGQESNGATTPAPTRLMNGLDHDHGPRAERDVPLVRPTSSKETSRKNKNKNELGLGSGPHEYNHLRGSTEFDRELRFLAADLASTLPLPARSSIETEIASASEIDRTGDQEHDQDFDEKEMEDSLFYRPFSPARDGSQPDDMSVRGTDRENVKEKERPYSYAFGLPDSRRSSGFVL